MRIAAAALLLLKVVLLLAQLGLSTADTARAKWAQDQNRILLTVTTPCQTQPTVEFKIDEFHFKCQGTDGKAYTFDITLREDIDPQASKCLQQEQETVCTLPKAIPHHFDRLTFDVKELASHISLDWTRWSDDDTFDDGDITLADTYADQNFAKAFDAKALSDALAKYPLVVLDLQYPWCTQCKNQKQKMIDAAKQLDITGVVAYMDAREEREMRHKYHPNCSHECITLVFKAGEEEPRRIKLDFDQKRLASQVRTMQKDTLVEITTAAQLAKLQKTLQPLFVAVVENNSSQHYNTVIELATKLFDTHNFAVVFADQAAALLGSVLPNPQSPSLVVFRDSEHEIFQGASFDVPSLSRFALITKHPRIIHYTWEAQRELEDLPFPVARFWVDQHDPKTPEYVEMMHSLARKYRFDMVFLQCGKVETSYMMVDFGLQEGLIPAFGLADSAKIDTVKYGMETEFTKANVESFINAFLRKEASASVKSEVAPRTSWTPGTLENIVGKTLLQRLKGTENVFVVFYKNWSKNWRSFETLLTEVARCVKHVPDVVVGVIDSSKNYVNFTLFPHVESSTATVRAYLINTVSGVRQQLFYENQFSRKAILNFLLQNVPSVKEGWDKIQQEVELIKEEAQARKQAAQQAIKEKQEKLDAIEKIKISEDGGILKQIFEEGSGEVPAPNSRIKAHYVGTLMDGKEFENSRTRASPFEFQLGKGRVIKCWDKAFATMKKGEKALLTCAPEYAYGSKGSPPNIPASATLQFEVELLEIMPPAKDEL